MAKGVRLYIDSDVTGVQSGVGKAQKSLGNFEKSAKRSESVMGGLSKTASGLGLAIGAGGLALGIEHSIEAFKNQEKQNARTVASLKTLGINTEAVRKKIDDVTAAQSKMSGFQETELKGSFGTLLRSTKDATEALKLNALAMDISRGSGKSLNMVAIAVAKVADGSTTALKRYGVIADKGATSTDVLAAAQKRYAGQAKEFGNTTAGAADKANAQLEKLQETVGAKFAPAMNAAAGATIKFAGATGSLVDRAGGLGPLITGAAGLGAFKLLGPAIGDAGSAVGKLGQVAGKKGAGSAFRVLGSAVADSVSPMTAAGIGAGLLAAGIYEIYSNSESADQAVQGFNRTLVGLHSALDQANVAKDQVNSAKDYVKVTNDAVTAAKAHSRALHADLVELTNHKGTVAQVAAADKKWQKSLDDQIPLIHQAQSAKHGLDSANQNLVTSTEGVTVAQGKQNDKIRDISNKVLAQFVTQTHAAGRGVAIMGGTFGTTADRAERFAQLMDRGAAATKNSDKAVSTADTNLAGFARHIGRLPTIREVKLVTKYSAQGLSLDQIEKKIEALHSKTITLTTQVNPLTSRVVAPKVTPKRTGPPFKPSAGGAYVAGAYSAGDRVPALLAGEEVVLNPRQQSMVEGGMSISGALAATGAPTIGQGGSFATGAGARGANASTVQRGGQAPKLANPIPGRVAKALARIQGAADMRSARIAVQIAQADARGDASGNVLAYQADFGEAQSDASMVSAILKNPAKALGVKGAKLTPQERIDLLGTLASLIGRAKGDQDTINQLQHPDSTGGPDTSGSTDTSTTAAPSPDLQAQLDQANARTAVAVRGGQLSEAELRAFTSTRDIAGGVDGGPQIAMLGDARSLQAFAGAANKGNGMQPFVPASRVSLAI